MLGQKLGSWRTIFAGGIQSLVFGQDTIDERYALYINLTTVGPDRPLLDVGVLADQAPALVELHRIVTPVLDQRPL